MIKLMFWFSFIVAAWAKSTPMKPLSVCCEIPDLGSSKFQGACSVTKNANILCDKIQCLFEKHGFLINEQTLNKEAYESHLRQWVKDQAKDKGVNWSNSVDKVIQDCVEKDLRQYSDQPCKAYDVFTCTEIALIKLRLAGVSKIGTINGFVNSRANLAGFDSFCEWVANFAIFIDVPKKPGSVN